MDNKTFTSLIEEKLRLLEVPEVVQEIVLHDLTLLILRRVYVDTVGVFSEEDTVRYGKALDQGNYELLYELIMGQERAQELALRSAEELVGDFVKELRE